MPLLRFGKEEEQLIISRRTKRKGNFRGAYRKVFVFRRGRDLWWATTNFLVDLISVGSILPHSLKSRTNVLDI